jgi:hypothetical protein
MSTTTTSVNYIGSTYANPAGYYIAAFDYQLAVCAGCYTGAEDASGMEELGDLDEPIGYWHETDAPVHCDACGALLETSLTFDGVKYVVEALADGSGDRAVLDAWNAAFRDVLPRCGCGNGARWYYDSANTWLCYYCNDHQDCFVDAKVRVYNERMTGELRAECTRCGHVWGYWDCACELDCACTH